MGELRMTDLYKPTGDQPRAIEDNRGGRQRGERYQTLLGATGTGKTGDHGLGDGKAAGARRW